MSGRGNAGLDAESRRRWAAPHDLRRPTPCDARTFPFPYPPPAARQFAGAPCGPWPRSSPAPTNLAAGTVTDRSVPLSWNAVAHATKYRVEYRASGTSGWTTDDDRLTVMSHTVDELICETAYEFGVSAFGDGTTHLAQWSAPATTSATTGACVPGQVTGSISADPTTIDPGGTSTLSWTTTNATSVSIDQGIGTVTANVAGSRSVTPSSRTTYTLSATGTGGPITRSVTINVRPKQLTLLGVDSGDGELTLRWTALGSDADSQGASRSTTRFSTVPPLAQVQVQILAPNASWPRDDDYAAGAVRPATETAHTFSDLDNGTTYDLRGRRLFDGRIAGAWSVEIQGTAGRSKLASPEVTARPLPGQEIRLEWDGVANSNSYLIKKIVGGITIGLKSTSLQFIMIPLERDLVGSGNPSVTYTVTAVDTTGNFSSSKAGTVTVVDNPILSINGARRNTGGQIVAEVRWPSVEGATSYFIHYRKLLGDHTDPDSLWKPESPYDSNAINSEPWKELEVSPLQNQPTYITQAIGDGELELYSIYGIYLTYTKGADRFGSARETYVWVSDRSPRNDERIATFPLRSTLNDMEYVNPRTYGYRVCFGSFPDEDELPADTLGKKVNDIKMRWTSLIEHALEQWESATDGLVAMTREDGDCADFETVRRKIAERHQDRIGNPLTLSEVNALLKLLENMDYFTDAETEQQDTDPFTAATRADIEANEVVVVNMDNPHIRDLKAVMIFPQLARHLGLASCIFLGTYGHECASPSGKHESRGLRTDILIPGNVAVLPPDISAGVSFNTCLDDAMDPDPVGAVVRPVYSRIYSTLVHEAGHVIGIAGGTSHDNWARLGPNGHDSGKTVIDNHPIVRESVMSYKGINLRAAGRGILELEQIPSCSPHPLDIMVIYALYQA